MKKSKKTLLLLVLAVALVATTAFSTMAWLIATDSKTNTFTVGHVNKPTTDPETGEEDPNLDGYIKEPHFNAADAKLLPGGEYAKDPYVGIGKGSEESFVYVYVDNDFYTGTYKDVYFTITDAWEPVTNRVVAGSKAGTYVSGLFKYSSTLTPTASADSWTTMPLFEQIDVDPSTSLEELSAGATNGSGNITIYAYIHQAFDGENNSLAETANTDAVAWSETLN